MLALLRRRCDDAGGQASWAAANGVSPQYVNDVLHGRREPGEGILRPLGLERVVTYRRVAASALSSRNPKSGRRLYAKKRTFTESGK